VLAFRFIAAGRKAQRSVIEVIALAYLVYPRYINPYTYERCEIEEVLPLLIQHKKLRSQHVKNLYCINFSMWKKAFIGTFIGEDADQIIFIDTLKKAVNKIQSGDGILAWGRKLDAEIEAASSEGKLSSDTPVWRMEDGFIRSVGLGVDLRRPSSLVLDKSGIYFDYSTPSDLENLLNTYDFSSQELEHADLFRLNLLEERVSKYNVGDDSSATLLADLPTDKTIILVPGQVNSDASIRYGCDKIKSNEELLRQVKLLNPNSYIIYKPHPDVVSGNRQGGMDYSTMNDYYDRLITGGDIFDCIACCNEVHTMTSLTGFEALLQGKKVVTYGAPFYSGWGLTEDHLRVERRHKVRTLNELIYAALLLYPRYVDWERRKITQADIVIQHISEQKHQQQTQNTVSLKNIKQLNWLYRLGLKANYLAEAIFHK